PDEQGLLQPGPWPVLRQDGRPIAIARQPRESEQPQAAEIIDPRAQEHQERPERVRPSVEEIAAGRDEGRPGPERQCVVEGEEQGQIVEDKQMSGKDHAFDPWGVGRTASGYGPGVAEAPRSRRVTEGWDGPGREDFYQIRRSGRRGESLKART